MTAHYCRGCLREVGAYRPTGAAELRALRHADPLHPEFICTGSYGPVEAAETADAERARTARWAAGTK